LFGIVVVVVVVVAAAAAAAGRKWGMRVQNPEMLGKLMPPDAF